MFSHSKDYYPPSYHFYNPSFDSRGSDASSTPQASSTHRAPSTHRASSPPSSWPDKGHPCPTHYPQSHSVKVEEDDDDENLPISMHFERDSAESSLFDQPAEEEDSDLALEAAQAKRKVCRAQKYLADCLLEQYKILIHISHCRAEAPNQHLLLADLNVGHMHSERRRKSGITMFTIRA
ncbi:uncharacterized protein EDB93DRAFT_1248706 [Suillus bovinus]|uniref:uncharacterized protein n=1 Tax=Suillus bovinus TaxID=48563 RepID=UPI001B887183|nr:uncharacterized protein EDB93DRAFT_1248706 [Suillus bovinus]KAG2153433.1 hypothetical protein EDB93DRAFT_1248706 [Suillus bovinus]